MDLYLYTHLDAIDETFIDQCLSWFPNERCEAILKVKHLQGRREKVVAYLLLCQLWEVIAKGNTEKGSNYLNIEGVSIELLHKIAQNACHYDSVLLPQLETDCQGKPYLSNYPNQHFNISHCRTAVCVAFSNRPIGIDVENIRSNKETLIERVCNSEEVLLISNSENPQSEFTRLWTRKEAYLKWLGTGIVGMDILKQIPPSEANLITVPLPEGQGFISVCEGI